MAVHVIARPVSRRPACHFRAANRDSWLPHRGLRVSTESFANAMTRADSWPGFPTLLHSGSMSKATPPGMSTWVLLAEIASNDMAIGSAEARKDNSNHENSVLTVISPVRAGRGQLIFPLMLVPLECAGYRGFPYIFPDGIRGASPLPSLLTGCRPMPAPFIWKTPRTFGDPSPVRYGYSPAGLNDVFLPKYY